MSTQLWFETHSTTTDNEAGIATGWLPGRLSDLGRRQAAELGVRIASRRPAAIFTSDLRRAVETVEIAIASAGPTAQQIPIFLDWRLRECDYGELNGVDHGQAHGDRHRYLTDPYPGGESWTSAVARAAAGIRDAVDRFDHHTIVVVGHIATRYAVIQLANETPTAELLSQPFRWQPGWHLRID